MDKWSVDEVSALLRSLEFSEQVVDAFKTNSVQGSDLKGLSEDDCKNELKMTNLQYKKLRRAIEEQEAKAGDGAGPSPAASPAASPGSTWGSAVTAQATVMPQGYSSGSSTDAGYPVVPERVPQPYGMTSIPAAAAMNPYAPAAAPYSQPPPQYNQPPPACAPVPGQPGPHGHPAYGVQPVPYGQFPQQRVSQIRREDAAEYKQLAVTITQLEKQNIGVELEKARAAIGKCEASLKAAMPKVQQQQQRVAKEKKDVDKIEADKWYPGKKILGTAHHEKKGEKERKEYEDALAALRKEEATVAAIKAEMEKANINAHRLQTLKGELDTSREKYERLFNRVFDGHSPACDTRELELKQQLSSIKPQTMEIKQMKSTYDQAQAHIKRGQKLIAESQALLQQAQGRATADILLAPGPTNGPLGMANDIQKNRLLQRADMLHMNAQQSFGQAKMLLPEMPGITEASIKMPRPFGDMIFDNIISDLIVRKKIVQSNEQMKKLLGEATVALQWCDGVISREIDPKFHRLTQEHADLNRQLDTHRVQLFNTACRQYGV
ncbi:hypothetical protein FVE85_5912 [Porphyridium purpureum]|uniref:SAM domain-containing protein n=1 Tax=Porphyridium purpureum TaxID=35688 RepID=A0A5J4Z6N9_PORPP|nr:hypothetical protein FVE85_5912 [Porphyridium purpureum]|eukprot:POR2485..scf295_1